MYKLFNDPKTGELSSVFQVETNTSIPVNPSNTDYQAYLKWLEDGNITEPEFTEEELAQQAKDKQIAEAKAYLLSTDYKFTADYDKDTTEVKVKRAEARAIIRSLEGN